MTAGFFQRDPCMQQMIGVGDSLFNILSQPMHSTEESVALFQEIIKIKND
jgi:hypothetical protein